MPDPSPPTQTGVAGRPSAPWVVGLGARLALGPAADARWAAVVADLAVDLDESLDHRSTDWHLGRTRGPGRMALERLAAGRLRAAPVIEALAGFPQPTDRVHLSTTAAHQLDVRVVDAADRSMHVKLDASTTVRRDARAPEVASDRRARLIELAADEQVLSGFVQVDTAHDPYEEAFAVRALGWDPALHAPGYPWTVLLTDGHLRALGGIERVRADAPVWMVETVDRPAPAAVLTLTEDPLAITAGSVAALRSFLLPVLPTSIAGPAEFVASPMQPLERPVWLFEGPALPGGAIAALRGIEPLDGSGPRRPPIELVGSPPADAADDPETLWCVLEVASRFVPHEHLDEILATIDAWAQVERSGTPSCSSGSIRSMRAAPRFEGAQPTIEWSIEPAGDPIPALQTLAGALRWVDDHLGGGVVGDRLRLSVR